MVEKGTDVPEMSRVSQTVIDTIADTEGRDPTDLTPRLDEVIDSDGLNRLFADTPTMGKVVFNYDRYEVTVFADGYVSVKDLTK